MIVAKPASLIVLTITTMPRKYSGAVSQWRGWTPNRPTRTLNGLSGSGYSMRDTSAPITTQETK